jgi:hypothetical protein
MRQIIFNSNGQNFLIGGVDGQIYIQANQLLPMLFINGKMMLSTLDGQMEIRKENRGVYWGQASDIQRYISTKNAAMVNSDFVSSFDNNLFFEGLYEFAYANSLTHIKPQSIIDKELEAERQNAMQVQNELQAMIEEHENLKMAVQQQKELEDARKDVNFFFKFFTGHNVLWFVQFTFAILVGILLHDAIEMLDMGTGFSIILAIAWSTSQLMVAMWDYKVDFFGIKINPLVLYMVCDMIMLWYKVNEMDILLQMVFVLMPAFILKSNTALILDVRVKMIQEGILLKK